MSDRFNDRHLSGASTRGSSPSDVRLEAQYDYALVASSWDRRCVAVTRSGVAAGVIQAFVPANKGVSGLRLEHDEAVRTFVSQAAAKPDVIEDHSERLDAVFERVSATIRDLRKQANRPLKILVDLSAAPRYFTLGAVALALNDAVAEFVDVFYSEGDYRGLLSSTEVALPEFRPTWEGVAVPLLEGDWYPTHERHFLVSVGFEAAQVARLAERWDPDAISVMFPSPGLSAEYEQRTEDANKSWMVQYGVGHDRRVNAPASDAIAAWRSLASSRVDPGLDNVYCVLCGTKPHSLAMALYSLARERPAVMYVRPTTHEERDVAENGVYWRYRVWDRSYGPASTPS